MSDVSFQGGQGQSQPLAQPRTDQPVAKPEVSAEESALAKEQIAAAQLEEKKKKLRAELAKLEADGEKKAKTLEERVFALESLVATLAGSVM